MTDTYRTRTPETWAQARADYLAGESAEAVCERYDLGLRTFRDRAAKGGWRRADQPDPPPAGTARPEPARSFADSVAEALDRADAALRAGRAAEAQRFLALASTYESLAARTAERDRRDGVKATADLTRDARALELLARAGAAEAKQEIARLKAGANGRDDASDLHGLHDLHGAPDIDAQIADLERRIAKRTAFGAPSNDLRVKLRKLRAPPPA